MKKIISIFILSVYSFAGFAQKRYYTPAAYQISDFDNKGQIGFSVARGNGYDANLAYSFSKDLYLLLAYGRNNRYERRFTILSEYGIKNNNNSFSAQIGYYKKINKSWLNKIEAYLGYSKIKINNYWDFTENERPNPANSQYTYGQYNSFFLGSNMILQNRSVEFSLGLRLSYYKYDTLAFYDKEPFVYYPISSVKGSNGITGELIQGIALQYKSFKLLLQGGISIPVFVPYALQTDSQYLNNGGYSTTYKVKILEGSFVFRLSLQCNLDLLKNKQ